jgi:Dolichyl-phosphate-mannose-protein mannosyltransferase
VGTGPYLLAVGHILHTATFDVTVWVAVCWVALRTLRTGKGHWWLLAGAVGGVGLLGKHLVVPLGLALVGPRRVPLVVCLRAVPTPRRMSTRVPVAEDRPRT